MRKIFTGVLLGVAATFGMAAPFAHADGPGVEVVGGAVHRLVDVPGRQLAERVVVGVQGDPDLLQVVLALRPGRGVPHLLDGGQEQPDQDGDDRDHDEKFDQREPAAMASSGHGGSPECLPRYGK